MVWLLLCRCQDTWEVLVWDLVDGPLQIYSVPLASLSLAICSVESCVHNHQASSVHILPHPPMRAGLQQTLHCTTSKVLQHLWLPSPTPSGHRGLCLFSSRCQVKDCSWDVGCSSPHSCLVRSFDKTPKGRQSFDQWAGVICVYLSNCSQFIS